MASASRTTVFLVVATVLIAALMLGACVLAAVNDAQAHVAEEQGRHVATPTVGVEVMQRAESKAHAVHASHAARQGAVSA
jgi:hypothetical protein